MINPALREAQRAEQAALAALANARADARAAERAKRVAVAKVRDRWVNQQLAAAAPEPGSTPEMIVIRSTHGIQHAPIVWDIMCDTQPKRSRLGEHNRRNADAYARQLRSMGHAVRVVQG